MARLIAFPEPPITEAEIRAVYALQRISFDAQSQARIALRNLCDRVERGASIEPCRDLDFIPEIRAIWPKPKNAAKSNSQPG